MGASQALYNFATIYNPFSCAFLVGIVSCNSTFWNICFSNLMDARTVSAVFFSLLYSIFSLHLENDSQIVACVYLLFTCKSAANKRKGIQWHGPLSPPQKYWPSQYFPVLDSDVKILWMLNVCYSDNDHTYWHGGKFGHRVGLQHKDKWTERSMTIQHSNLGQQD